MLSRRDFAVIHPSTTLRCDSLTGSISWKFVLGVEGCLATAAQMMMLPDSQTAPASHLCQDMVVLPVLLLEFCDSCFKVVLGCCKNFDPVNFSDFAWLRCAVQRSTFLTSHCRIQNAAECTFGVWGPKLPSRQCQPSHQLGPLRFVSDLSSQTSSDTR